MVANFVIALAMSTGKGRGMGLPGACLIYPVKNCIFRYEFFVDSWTVNEGSLYVFWYLKHIITLKS